MNGNGAPPPVEPGTFNVQIQTAMLQAVTEIAGAWGASTSEVLNMLLILGKRQFDSAMMLVPYQMALNERHQRAIAASVGVEEEDAKPEEQDTRSAEEILEERRKLAQFPKPGTKEPS